jgi:hypothetical protein
LFAGTGEPPRFEVDPGRCDALLKKVVCIRLSSGILDQIAFHPRQIVRINLMQQPVGMLIRPIGQGFQNDSKLFQKDTVFSPYITG